MAGRSIAIVVERTAPRVPSYAWAWLQRSRPVVDEIARRLTGGPPTPDFLSDLRERFETDPFTRDVVIAVVAEVAFNGRVPSRRPAGTSWDRGLTWWAATIAGVTLAEFEARPPTESAAQRRLFDDAQHQPLPSRRGGPTPSGAERERAALAAALRDLLDSAEGDQVPASAVRQLLAWLEER